MIVTSFQPYRIVASSQNTNAFGLRQYCLVNQAGRAWSVCRTIYGGGVWNTGDTVQVPHDANGGPLWARLGGETPRRLTDPPPAAVAEIWPERADPLEQINECPECEATFHGADTRCPECNHCPTDVDEDEDDEYLAA